MMPAVNAADIAPMPYAWEIRATGLKVRAGRKRMAVDGLDLSLGTGVHGVLGPNGAGKTTLVRALATVLRPAEGTLELLGESVGGMGEHRALRRRIGYLPQEFGYYKRFTVREFVEYMAWLKEVPKADIPAAVQRAVERVGLADRADERMKALSGGAWCGGWASLRPSSTTRRSCCWTSRRPASTRRSGCGSGSCCSSWVRTPVWSCRPIWWRTCHLVEDVAAACTDVVLFAEGRLVFQGLPDELASVGGPEHEGDSPLERGYSAMLRGPGQGRGTW